MGLKIGDYVIYRFISNLDISKVGRVVKITYGTGRKSTLYNVDWIKAPGLSSSKFKRKELEKISEKEAVIEML